MADSASDAKIAFGDGVGNAIARVVKKRGTGAQLRIACYWCKGEGEGEAPVRFNSPTARARE